MKHLICKTQHYLWGKRGDSSFVGQLYNEMVEEDEYYAEFWMGTHPNGPTELADNKTPLKDYLEKNPDVLGKHEGGDLQFLFKILSVAKALSIQSHPTKEQAKVLHANDPTNYPDSNHKPEMAIALTDFELLCGFQKPHGILSNIKAHKELLELIGEENLSDLAEEHGEEKHKKALKKIFTQVWTSPEISVKHVIKEILARLFQKDDRAPVDDLVLRLSEQFPEDIGILAPFFLNYFTLKPGEATFLGPNEPHAYLSGDCIECMALSDNTIRAGLTPKYKDVNTLCENLTYRMYDPPYFQPNKLADGTIEYAPPVDEFAVHKITHDVSSLQTIAAGSFFIVVAGEATMNGNEGDPQAIEKGTVLFLPQNFKCALSDQSDEFLAFRAFNPPNK